MRGCGHLILGVQTRLSTGSELRTLSESPTAVGPTGTEDYIGKFYSTCEAVVAGARSHRCPGSHILSLKFISGQCGSFALSGHGVQRGCEVILAALRKVGSGQGVPRDGSESGDLSQILQIQPAGSAAKPHPSRASVSCGYQVSWGRGNPASLTSDLPWVLLQPSQGP